MVRQRDDLYIQVPSFFRCPISLDVMKSPVSLCTGVTYDRASIQRWLDGGNNTCPATMQVLQTKDLVPNLTLQRLIRMWSDSVRRVDSPGSAPPLERDHAAALARSLMSDNSRESAGDGRADSMSRILQFASESEDNCEFLARIDGFPSALLSFLSRDGDGTASEVASLELLARVLAMVIDRVEDRDWFVSLAVKSDRRCLDSILLVTERGKLESKIASVKLLASIAINGESKLAIAEKDELLQQLLNLTAPETDPILLEASLSCLVQVSAPKRVRVKLVALQAVKALSKLLSSTKSTASATEKALKLLETLSSCKEGRAALCGDAACLESILHKVFKVSTSATEHAMTILWSLCYLFREESAEEVVSKCNGMAKILLLMQSNCTPTVRQMCGDLLKVFRVCSSNSSKSKSRACLSSYETKTTHIMPC